MCIIGVTGGTGSGKSTVASLIARRGGVVIDADKIARKVTEKGGKALEELTGFFGKDILTRDGDLNRSKLAGMVFGNPEMVEKLNEITHKYVIEAIDRRIEEEKEAGTGLLVLDVPIPVERGFLDTADVVWAVTAGREERISRIISRSGFTREEAARRIDSQMSDEEYGKIADLVIVNDGSEEKLAECVQMQLKQILDGIDH